MLQVVHQGVARPDSAEDIIVIVQRIGRALSWIWLVCLVAACQNSGSATPSGLAVPTPTTGRPMSLPVIKFTRTLAPTVQPSPTATTPSATATPIQSAAVFTLTILHTGQVYGETGPCG